MRRSLCVCQPSVALAGQIKTWRFVYTTASLLPKNTLLKFDLVLQVRPSDWELPSEDPSDDECSIWLQTPSGKIHESEEVLLPNQIFPSFEFVLDEEVEAGQVIEIFLGSTQKEKGCQAQTTTQRRRPFHLYVDSTGKGNYKDPEVFSMDVRGGALENIQIFTPSLVAKNRRFDIVVRFEDAYGNLTNNAPEGTLIELSYEFLRESLNWKLFVPETGFIVLPNLYFNEIGVYRIQLKSSMDEQCFYSCPIKCFAENDFSIYWGHLHGESQKIDAADQIETYLRHKRDELGHQFAASSCFESTEETSTDVWKKICTSVAEYNEDNRFAAILGLQWLGDEGEGLRQLFYWKDSKPLMRKKDTKYTNLKKIYKIHSPKEVLAIPQFTMAKGVETDFADFNSEFEHVVEIYNAWGCSECTKEEGNLRPIESKNGKGYNETKKGSIRAALNQNMRFGFVAGGLDDRGIYAPLFESDQTQYSPGITAIVAVEQARDTLMQALASRSCYATTGAKISLGFYIAGSPIGTELTTKNKPGLAYNRHLTGFVCGTSPIKEIEIIRNGTVLTTLHPNEVNVEFEYDDLTPLGDVALNSPDERPPFAYYYMRVIQEDGHIAWSSPIWVDLCEAISTPAKPPADKKRPT